MPQIVRKERKVRTLAPGAKVVTVNGTGDDRIVETVDHKVKWSTITYTDGGKQRIEGDEMVIVESEEPTDEERAAERLASRIWGIEREITQAPENLAAAREKMIAELDSTWTSHWAYQNFVAAKEEARLWAEVARVWELAQKPEHAERAIEAGEEPFETIVDAKEYVVRKYREQLLEHYTPTSRSTSVVSNAFEDVQREVQLKFVRSRWF